MIVSSLLIALLGTAEIFVEIPVEVVPVLFGDPLLVFGGPLFLLVVVAPIALVVIALIGSGSQEPMRWAPRESRGQDKGIANPRVRNFTQHIGKPNLNV
ncbi:MAG: hypothetical protein ACTIC1_20425 [Brevibacterium sp.]|uniref:hypothetical protein n=1 Tax=Brevibacterium aurantiacum TaxID=273384 RepID=UPI001055CF4C|nr:hypothetical protein [Brevibacterium aurantiacum]MDN5587889.1 hypothetical protein [Brevibacterium sp.]